MAGKGDYPFRSAWLLQRRRRRRRGPTLPAKPLIPASNGSAQEAVFKDWFFEAATSAAVSATQTLGGVSQTASIEVAVGAASISASQTLAGISQTASLAALAAISATQTLAGVSQTATIGARASVSTSQSLAGLSQNATLAVDNAASVSASQTLDDVSQDASVSSVVSLHGRKARRRGRSIDDRVDIPAYAEEISAALHAADVSQAEANELEQAARELRQAIQASEFNRAFIVSTADALIKAAHHAAMIEDARKRQEQLAIAAAIAAQIEDDIRDEEEAILLLFA